MVLSPDLEPTFEAAVAPLLLTWYDRHRRVLPWRALPGQTADPYHVWLSEVMLQQTTVATVADYFRRFLERWPTVHDLAQAPLDAVLTQWAGLGYYARARNLHRCAQYVSATLGGVFPQSEAALKRLPGIGEYTAAAIAAIAFDQPATVVDGNVERVVARLFDLRAPLPGVKTEIRAAAALLTPQLRPGDFAQAMMDLGATVCTPKSPKCILCPLREGCLARLAGVADQLPVKAPKKDKPTRRAVAFWLVGPAGEVLLRRRPEKGLLGGMMEIPSSPWEAQTLPDVRAVLPYAPAEVFWRPVPGLVRHTFTHFHLELGVVAARADQAIQSSLEAQEAVEQRFVGLDALSEVALPTAMTKIVRHVLASAGKPGATV